MKRNYYKSILLVLTELHKDHPTYELGKHFSTALSDYGDIWGTPDKEVYAALKKYQAELSQAPEDITEDYIAQILKEGQDLDHILDENEEED